MQDRKGRNGKPPHLFAPMLAALGCTSEEICEKVCKQHYQEPLGEDCPPDLQDIINQCRDHDPSMRPTAKGMTYLACSWCFVMATIVESSPLYLLFPWHWIHFCFFGGHISKQTKPCLALTHQDPMPFLGSLVSPLSKSGQAMCPAVTEKDSQHVTRQSQHKSSP